MSSWPASAFKNAIKSAADIPPGPIGSVCIMFPGSMNAAGDDIPNGPCACAANA